MRTFLTFVAVALVTALTVALLAPPLIDWSARREMLARVVAERIGAPVVISGPISLRMLPTPYLELVDVKIGPSGEPFLKAPAIRFEFGLFSLFGGKLRLDDVDFDRPSIHIGPNFAPPGDGQYEFAHIRASHAEIRVDRTGATPIVIHDLNFVGSALSPRGPFRGDGDFAWKGAARANYQIAAEAFQFDALPIRAEFEAGETRAAFEGRIGFSSTPSYEGTATASGQTPAPDGVVWPWRLAGHVSARGDEATLDGAQISLGPDARALEAEGAMALKFGAELALEVDLKAKSLNFDSLLRGDKATFATPSKAAEAFGALSERVLRSDAPLAAFSLKLEAGSAFLGARPLHDLKMTASGAPGDAMRLAIQSGLPGHANVNLDGALELGAAPIFRGRAGLQVEEFAPLAGWLSEGDPQFASRLSTFEDALPNGAISASGDLEISPQGFSARRLSLDVSTSRFKGDAIYRRPDPDRRASLYLDLATDALDIEVAPNVEAGLGWLGDTDLDFRLSAKSLRVARVGLASLQGGSLAIRAKKEGAKFSLKQFSLADLGGASIEVEGETSPAGRWTRVKLDAGRLHDFAALLARAAPGPLTQWLQQRADDLKSARATIEARRDGPPLPGPFGLDFLKADGDVDATRFALTVNRAPAPVDGFAVALSLDAPDAGGLLRKLGARLSASPAGRAELSLSGVGDWEHGFDGKGRLALAGADFNWKGALHPNAPAAAPIVSGPLTLKSADLFPGLSALGLATTGAGIAAPADLSAYLEAYPDGAKISGLSGLLAGSRVKGDLAFAAPKREAFSLEDLVAMAKTDVDAPGATTPPAIVGALEFDRASASALLALALGRPGPIRPSALWSEAKFAAPLLTPLPVDLTLKVGVFDFGFGAAKGLSARLRLDRDRLALDDVKMAVNGGKAAGRLDLRRDKTQATASGGLQIEGVGVERGAVRGKFDAAIEFVGTGGSAAALAAGLAGTGRVTIVEAKWPRLDPDALARVMTKLERSAGAPPGAGPLAAEVGEELDRGPLKLTNVSGPLALSSGALRFGPFDAAARDGSASLSGALDFSDLTLSADATLIDGKASKFWSGPPPTIEVGAKGSLDAISRKVDVSLLSAGLAAEAIARETERIANFEADVRERAAFNRKFKAERFLARRESEIAAFEADQERQRLMNRYLGPYSDWAASRREGAATAGRPGREAAKYLTTPGL